MAKITQEAIAQATGVSRATVSAVLSGRQSIRLSDETTRRVLDAARRLGYRRGLRRESHPRSIGLLVTEAVQKALANDYYAAIYAGLEETLWENDYHLVFSSRRDHLHQVGAVPKFVRHGHVAGVVVLSTTVSVPSLVDTGLPVVSVGHYVSHPGVDSIYPDNARGAALAAEHLLGLGHRQFLVLTGAPDNHNFAERVETFAQTIRSAGGKIAATLVLQPHPAETYGAAHEKMREFLRQGDHRFTAVMAMNDAMASGAIAALREAGVATPQHVSVIGFLDIPLAAQQEPPLTTVRVSPYEMGRLAAYRLLDRIQHPDQPAGLKIQIPVELVVRASTAPPPK